MFDHEVTVYKTSRKYPRRQRNVTVIFHIFTACTSNFGKQYFQKICENGYNKKGNCKEDPCSVRVQYKIYNEHMIIILNA